mmetsp:Transcript_18803/g.43535  ORF Transcript_18803/g.43535 Transcript_18803/m.43535 type:complete len:157 (-) Transcript_18803:89-559(-)
MRTMRSADDLLPVALSTAGRGLDGRRGISSPAERRRGISLFRIPTARPRRPRFSLPPRRNDDDDDSDSDSDNDNDNDNNKKRESRRPPDSFVRSFVDARTHGTDAMRSDLGDERFFLASRSAGSRTTRKPPARLRREGWDGIRRRDARTRPIRSAR